MSTYLFLPLYSDYVLEKLEFYLNLVLEIQNSCYKAKLIDFEILQYIFIDPKIMSKNYHHFLNPKNIHYDVLNFEMN